MSYSHYWYRTIELPAPPFSAWAGDVRTIIANLPARSSSAGAWYLNAPLLLTGEPDGLPVVSDDEVLFDGAGQDPINGENLGHCAFWVPRIQEPATWQQRNARGWPFDFCTTARKPYDLAVTAALIWLAHHFPEGVEVQSDGDVSDWAPALELCSRLFGSAVLPPEIAAAAADDGSWLRR